MLLRLPLLLLSLTPLLAALLVGAINPRPPVSLRLFTWRTPTLPLGGWIALAGAGGACLSGTATALALRQAAPAGRRRRTAVQEFPDPRQAPFRAAPEPPASWPSPREWPPEDAGAGPTRGPGEPAPTISVPFRVLHRPSAAGRSFAPEPVPARQGASGGDDWQLPEEEDW